MTESLDVRARHSLRLLLESDREFGLEVVAWRTADLAPEADAAPAELPSTPPGPTPPIATPHVDARPLPANDAQAPASEPRPTGERPAVAAPSTPYRARLPETRTAVPPLREHAGDPERRRALDALEEEVVACAACGLCRDRQLAVPGEGSVDADLMFVGEGPGADENRSGRPFVGAAGALLTKIVDAMGFTRESVFIANAVKCRPPGNRTPTPIEVESCRGFLERQIAIVRPKVIVALGRPAAQALLKTTLGINALRGKVQAFQDVAVVPTFHPAYLLRKPEDKGKTWQDVQLAAKLVVERGGVIPRPESLARNAKRSDEGAG